MKFLARRNNTELVQKSPEQVVSVTDIKEYLVKEYERVRCLKEQIESLENELVEAQEIKFKYEATLVTLKEYSDRLSRADDSIRKEKQRLEDLRGKLRECNDELNSYKIKLNNAALLKEDIEQEIVEDIKSDIISEVNAIKGKLSKRMVCDIISQYKLHVKV